MMNGWELFPAIIMMSQKIGPMRQATALPDTITHGAGEPGEELGEPLTGRKDFLPKFRISEKKIGPNLVGANGRIGSDVFSVLLKANWMLGITADFVALEAPHGLCHSSGQFGAKHRV